MRMILTASLLLLGACTTAAAADEDEAVPVHGRTAGYKCDAGKAQSLVGQPATAALGARALQLTGARGLRWIRPGDAVTMDFREDRLNLELDGKSQIKALRCG